MKRVSARCTSGRNARRTGAALLLLLSAPLLAPTSSASQAAPWLTTHSLVELSGIVEATALGGGLHVRASTAPGDVYVDAALVRLVVAWEQGVRTDVDGRTVEHVTDWGERIVTLEEANLSFAPYGTTPQFLAFSDGRAHEASVLGGSGARASAEHDLRLTGAGWSPERADVGGGPRPGFWYRLDGPVVWLEGSVGARAAGSFSFFINNVTIRGTGANGEMLDEWAGTWEESPGQPLTRYERRVAVLEITNGTLSLGPGEAVALFGPFVEVSVSGGVSAPDVTGRLPRDGDVLVFDRDPLVLHGTGAVSLRALRPEGAPPPAPDGAAQSPLWLRTSGALRLLELRDVEIVPGPGPPWAQGTPLALLSIGGIAALAVATAGLARAGIVPHPVAPYRRWRHETWTRRARDAAERREWAEAASHYGRATRAKPDDALTWYERALAELEAGDLAAAETVAREAERVPGVDRLDLIELRAAAAWRRADRAAFEQLLGELAAAAPDMARGLASDLGIDAAALSVATREALQPSTPGGGFDGYA